LSVFFRRRKKRKYGDVKPPVKTRGSLLEWLSPRTKEAQRFIRAPELLPIGSRWGGRSLGQYAVSAGAVTPFIANPPAFVPVAPALSGAPQVPTGQPSAQPQPSLGTALGVPPTRTFSAGGRTYTQAPTPFVKPAPTGAGYEVPAPTPTRPVYGRGF